MQTLDSILRRHSLSSKMAKNLPSTVIDNNRVYLGVSHDIVEISYVLKVNPTFIADARWVVQL